MALMASKGMSKNDPILIRAYKKESEMEVWKRGVGYMLRRPVLGVGADNFYVAEGTLSERGRQQQFGRGFKWSAAHNSFVQIGAELGIPGLVAFIAMLIVAFRTGLRSSARSHDPDSLTQHALGQAFAATVIGYVVTAFNESYAADSARQRTAKEFRM